MSWDSSCKRPTWRFLLGHVQYAAFGIPPSQTSTLGGDLKQTPNNEDDVPVYSLIPKISGGWPYIDLWILSGSRGHIRENIRDPKYESVSKSGFHVTLAYLLMPSE